jgi:hypothetical protein
VVAKVWYILCIIGSPVHSRGTRFGGRRWPVYSYDDARGRGNCRRNAK